MTLPPAKDAGVLRLRKRAEFLQASNGQRASVPGLNLQARNRADGDPALRIGFTCSKKVGNAVARNRAKRRLREAARLAFPDCGRPGWDYVLVGKAEATAARRFADLQADLAAALVRVHAR